MKLTNWLFVCFHDLLILEDHNDSRESRTRDMKRFRLTSLAWLFSCQRTKSDKKSADSFARQTWKIETCQMLVKTFYSTITWCLEFLSSGHFLITALPGGPQSMSTNQLRSADRVYRLTWGLSSPHPMFFHYFGDSL